MNLGQLLLLLIAWAAAGALGMILLRRKGYFQDISDASKAWDKGAWMQEETQWSALSLPSLGGLILLVASLVLPRKRSHNSDDETA